MFKPAAGGNGDKGSVEIYMEDKDGNRTGPFKTSYQLQIVDFDVVDENEYGIYEFGENVIIKNILVNNKGF